MYNTLLLIRFGCPSRGVLLFKTDPGKRQPVTTNSTGDAKLCGQCGRCGRRIYAGRGGVAVLNDMLLITSYCSGQPTGRLEFRSGIVLDVFFVLFMFLWIYITDSLRWNIT